MQHRPAARWILGAILAAGCTNGGAIHPARPPVPRVHLRVRVAVAASEGRVRSRVEMDGAQGVVWALAERATVRCVSSDCAVEPVTEVALRYPVFRIAGVRPAIEIEAHLDGELVELSTRDAILFPVSYEDVPFLVTLEAQSDEGEILASRALPVELTSEDTLELLAAPDLVSSRVRCGETEVIVGFDRDFPGSARANALAMLACHGIEEMRARWGEPEGEGAFRLLLPPRRGGAHYLTPRGLVVPAYYGGFPAVAGESTESAWASSYAQLSEPIDWAPMPQTDTSALASSIWTRFAVLHEAAHAWFASSPPSLPRLHEGLACYAALRAMNAIAEPADALYVHQVQIVRFAGAGDTDYEMRDYDEGTVTLDRLEAVDGSDRVDRFLRELASQRPKEDDAFRSIVGSTLDDDGARVLDALRIERATRSRD